MRYWERTLSPGILACSWLGKLIAKSSKSQILSDNFYLLAPMLKYLLLVCLWLPAFYCAAKDTTVVKQTTKATLLLAYPLGLKAGKQPELLVTVKSKLPNEWTGYLSLDLTNATSGEIVDGIFGNAFSNQYFTISSTQTATLKFPISIPYNFKQPVLLKLTLHDKVVLDSMVTTLRIR